MNQFTAETTRRLFRERVDAMNVENEHRRICRREGQRLLVKGPPRSWCRPAEDWESVVRRVFGDVL